MLHCKCRQAWACHLPTARPRPPLSTACAAAHEVLRQIWVFSNQFFTSMDIATQVGMRHNPASPLVVAAAC